MKSVSLALSFGRDRPVREPSAVVPNKVIESTPRISSTTVSHTRDNTVLMPREALQLLEKCPASESPHKEWHLTASLHL